MTPASSGIAFEQRLQARRVLLPQRLPQRERLVGRLELAVDRGLRLARVAARELGVKVSDLLAQDFGDRRALARRRSSAAESALSWPWTAS